jgi:hypothetical protein
MRKSSLAILLALSACGGGNTTLQANRAPVADAGAAQTVAAGTSIKLAGSGSDADQDSAPSSVTITAN